MIVDYNTFFRKISAIILPYNPVNILRKRMNYENCNHNSNIMAQNPLHTQREIQLIALIHIPGILFTFLQFNCDPFKQKHFILQM